MTNSWGQSKKRLKLVQPGVRCKIDFSNYKYFFVLEFNFKWLRKQKKRKAPPVSIYTWCALWVHWKHTGLKFWCMSFLQTGKALFVYYECMYIWVCFSNCVYALFPEEQRLGVLPPRHLWGLGLERQWFLPWISQASLFLPIQLILSPEGHSTELGEHQSSVMAST